MQAMVADSRSQMNFAKDMGSNLGGIWRKNPQVIERSALADDFRTLVTLVA
jgi:hypothetical protein